MAVHDFLLGVRNTVLPERAGRQGPLAPLLLAMTVVTGLVDSFSYLGLGHVFVANMTGNVVFLAFALAGAPGFSIPASLVALASFAAGAAAGGRIGARQPQHRGRMLSIDAAVQAGLVAVAVLLAALASSPVTTGYRYGLIVALGVAMGVQNSAARKLAVPDLTTTVLTLTITGIAADSTDRGASAAKAGRRVTAVVAMFAGGVVGAVLVVAGHLFAPLVLSLLLIVGVCVTARILGASGPDWVHLRT